MPHRVIVTHHIPEEGPHLLREHGFRVIQLDHFDTHRELLAKAKRADALLCLLTDRIDDAVLAMLPRLRILSNYAVGFDNVDVRSATRRGILVTNTPGVPSNTVAEHVIAMMLGLTTRLVEADAFTRAGKYHGWDPLLLLGTDVVHKTLGIMGLGNIGKLIALKARGLGMQVLYTDAAPVSRSVQKSLGVKPATMKQLLKKSDVVVTMVPLMPSTRHLIAEKELRMMKKNAFIINAARGPVIKEVALVHALQRGIIRGAALDVFEFEPRISSALRKLRNVILTPHTASASAETRANMSISAAQNVVDFFAGKKPAHTVNPQVFRTER